MPNIRTRKDSVAIDTVPLPERKAKGIIKKVGEKYILEVEERKIEIPVGPAMSEAEVKRFIGKEVTAFFSATRPKDVVAIGTWPTPEKPAKFVCVLCYVPPPDIVRRIEPRVREVVIREMVNEKIISPALARNLRAR
jgi:hypothetical protein